MCSRAFLSVAHSSGLVRLSNPIFTSTASDYKVDHNFLVASRELFGLQSHLFKKACRRVDTNSDIHVGYTLQLKINTHFSELRSLTDHYSVTCN